MDHPILNHVRDLSIGFGMNYLLLSVDRIFVRERVKKVGDPPRVIKEHGNVDMLCWDAEVCCSCDYLYCVVLSHMPSSLFEFVVLSITQIIFAGNSGVM